ncbi:MAG: hypothetical protein JJ979_02505 [Roseibium sp.]|nr:hypothetical protein [Roseibium sp.]
MRTIKEQEFHDILSPSVSETFEVFGFMSFYLSVLTNGKDYVAELHRFQGDDHDFFNGSCFWSHDGTEYAFQRAVREGRMTVEHIAYDSLAEALQHASELLSEHS